MKIQICNISKRFKKKQILSDVSIEAESGMCVGIIGANGSGKSTLLNILAGVAKADSGSFYCDGTDLLKDGKTRSKIIGYVPQGTPLIEELTAYDNLLMWYSRAKIKSELESGVLKMLGIGDFLKKPVSKLSGGMKKRLSIGCAVAGNPQILMLDEPSAALDLICKEDIAQYITDCKSKGCIVIIATHEVRELELCDRLYILKEGAPTPFEFNGNVERLVSRL